MSETQHLLYHLSISQTHWQVSRPPRRQRAVVLTQLAPSDSAVRACAADSGHARHDDHRPVTGLIYGTHTTSPLIYESGKLTKVVSWCYKLPRRLARGQFSLHGTPPSARQLPHGRPEALHLKADPRWSPTRRRLAALPPPTL